MRAALVVFGFSVACTGAAPAVPPSSARPSPVQAERAGAPPVVATRAEAPAPGAGLADLDRALATTSRFRELSARSPVKGRAVSRDTLAAQVRRVIDRDLPLAVVQAQQDLLVMLGVVGLDFDYLAAVVALMGAELAGYYDPADKTMYLAADLGDRERDATLSHELVHALQDQHYDLARLLGYRPDGSDLQSALHALAEGDAMSAMMDQLLAPKGVRATDVSDELLGLQVRAAMALSMSPETPELLKRSLIAPYVDGVAFVHALRRAGGFAAVDAAWREPPVSTEQVLHPEKYLAREPPEAISPPPAPAGSSFDPPYTDVLGEQSVRQLLEEWMPRRSAIQASSGWAGDRLAVFRGGSRVAVGWHLRYDDVAGAERVAAGLVRAGQAPPGAEGGSVARSTCMERPDRGPVHVERRGRDVAFVAGPADFSAGAARSGGTCATARAWAAQILRSDRLGRARAPGAAR